MGIDIRYLAPAAAGTAFAYSVERHADEAFFDFELDMFRRLDDIPVHAVTRPLIYYDDGAVAAHFEQVEEGARYTFRIHHVGVGNKIIAELPITILRSEGRGATIKGEEHMEPSYRAGKKFIGNQAIEARHRLTFYGNDGFTVHTATLWDDGTSSCNCPRWGPKVDGRRQCVHSVRALALTANIDETGDQPEPPAPKPQRGTNPFRRRSRPVDT